MSLPKQLWVLAGGNGAGKSTFYRTQLAPLGMSFVNADILAKGLFPDEPESHSYEAAALASELRTQLLIEGRSFCFETVFSHYSKIDFLAQAKTLGYEIVLVVIHLESVQLNHARVYLRVLEGGHTVPADKIESRIPRLLTNIKTALPLCDQVILLDNSRDDDPFRVLATLNQGQPFLVAEDLPAWAIELLTP